MSDASASATAATRLVRALLDAGPHDSADDTVQRAGAMCVRITRGLSRWFGPFGSHALVMRALAGVRGDHPVLANVTLSDGPDIVGLADAAAQHGDAAAVDAIVAATARLSDLLARLIGDDLAISLLEQSITLPAGDQPVAGDTNSSVDSTDGGPRTATP